MDSVIVVREQMANNNNRILVSVCSTWRRAQQLVEEIYRRDYCGVTIPSDRKLQWSEVDRWGVQTAVGQDSLGYRVEYVLDYVQIVKENRAASIYV